MLFFFVCVVNKWGIWLIRSWTYTLFGAKIATSERKKESLLCFFTASAEYLRGGALKIQAEKKKACFVFSRRAQNIFEAEPQRCRPKKKKACFVFSQRAQNIFEAEPQRCRPKKRKLALFFHGKHRISSNGGLGCGGDWLKKSKGLFGLFVVYAVDFCRFAC